MRQHKSFINISLIIFISIAMNVRAELLDMVIFGHDSSETAHNLLSSNSASGPGNLGESFRQLQNKDEEESWMQMTMKVDPDKQNYLTLKFWGSDTLDSRQYLHLYYWHYFFGALKRLDPVGSFGTDQPEIITVEKKSPPYPGRFVYVSYFLPDDVVSGADTLDLRLANATLPIYRAYTHTHAYFEPGTAELQGVAPGHSTPYPSPNGKTQIEHVQEQLDLAVDRFLTWQYWGEEWETWVANGWSPEIMTGALNIHGAKDSTWTLDEWKRTWSARQNGHVRAQMPIETIAQAFHASWSKHYQDSTLIDRVVKALDFLRVAQGSDGGYIELENVPGGRWIGAPDRTEGVGSLMGFGMKGAPGAFLTMQNEIMTDTLMNEIINEGDSTITRRQAYINLFTGFREYLTMRSSRGHASNQDVVNLTAAYLADQCLIALDPQLGWPEETKQYWLDVCIGLEDGIYGGPWMSAKGTSMEGNGLAHGGYDSGYGEHNTEHLARLAIMSGEERVREYLAVHLEALGRMRYLGYDNDLRPVVRRDGWLGWRKNAAPGAEAYGEVPMAAVLLDDQLSLHGIQLAAKHGAFYKVDFSSYWVHLMAESSRMMRQVDYLEQALELPATDARFPFEADQPDYAWADEQAAVVVIKDDNCDLRASMQWRHPLLNDVRHVDNALPNDKARVHYTTPDYDLMATTAMQSTNGMYSLYIWQFGKYLVAMNASPDTDYELELPAERPGSAMELISGQEIDLLENPIIQPQNTLVLDWPEDLPVSIGEDVSRIPPVSFELRQNYPNPFNPVTAIGYRLSAVSDVELSVYNTLGQKVVTLVSKKQPAGVYKVEWNASHMASGIYYYQIITGEFQDVKKMILLK